MMSRAQQLMAGLFGTVGLLALTVGVPVVLSLLVGWPLPHELPSFDDVSNALTHQMTYRQIDNVLAIVGWVLWIQFLWCVVVEAVAIVRHDLPSRVRFAFGTQLLARNLVLAAIVLIGSTQRPISSGEAVLVAVPAASVSVDAAPIAVSQNQIPTPSVKTVAVKARDDLWSLSERHLGDPLRWREIVDLNCGVLQQDGRSLKQPDLIRPGWTLVLPGDATGIDVPSVQKIAIPKTSVDLEESQSAAIPDVAISETPAIANNINENVDVNAEKTEISDDVESGVGLPQGILATGVAAAGIVSFLAMSRRVQQRRRRPGQIIPPLNEALAPTEAALRIAADASDASRLDAASRALGFCISESACEVPPRIDAVRISKDGIEFLFAEMLDVPSGPFVVSSQGRSWTLPTDVHEVRVGSLAQLMPSVLPALASVGRLDESLVLVDLEAALWTTVVGTDDKVDDFIASLVMELGTSVWADFLDVVVVGGESRQGRFERVEHVVQSNERVERAVSMGTAVANELKVSGLSDTFAARLQPGSDGWSPSIVVFCEPIESSIIENMIGEIDPGHGLVVVTVGEHAKADRRIELVGNSVSVVPPDISVDSKGTQASDIAVVHDLLDQATESPVDVVTEEVKAIDLRDVQSVVVASQSDPEVMVRVLGPVMVEGGAGVIDRPKSIELVTYLALHPAGVSDDKLKTVLWPDTRVSLGSFHQTMSKARTRLGEAGDGTLHLPSVKNGLYALGESVAVDVSVFEKNVREARGVQPQQQILLLTEALSLVRGAPFAETSKGYQWAYNEGIVGHLESMVANAAHELAELCFDSGDYDLGHWAAKQGVLVSPGWEPLYRLRMLAYDSQGNPAGVRSVMEELTDLVEAIEPFDTLHPETVELWKRLDPRQRV